MLPDWVTVTRGRSSINDAGDIIGDFGVATYDPFERRPDGLLLTESFARLDLGRPRKVRAWMLESGVLCFDDFYQEFREMHFYSGEFEFQDPASLVVHEQRLIRWYLELLVRLTSTLPPPAGQGMSWAAEWFSDHVARRDSLPSFKPTARSAFDAGLFALGTAVEHAVAPSVHVRAVRPRSGAPAFVDNAPFAVIPVLERRWVSILAPISLHLYEGLRRISEARPAARICRECGNAFLILDGRRERFCTSAERTRFNQRQYRARKLVGPVF